MSRRKMLWFERLFGIEEDFKSVRQDLKCEKGDDGLFYISGPNDIRYCCGRFEHVSVEALQQRVPPPPCGVKSVMSIVQGDVVQLINNPANNGAIFQVASQFNCLEFVNPAITPEAGVDRYEYDHTQGPACSIACGAGTVYRNYFIAMETSDKHPEVQLGQTADRQLDGFEDIADMLGNREDELFRLKNGYLTADAQQLNSFNERYKELVSEKCWTTSQQIEAGLWNKLKLGVHYDVEVTSSNWGERVSTKPEQRVTQVFASAAAVGYSRQIERHNWVTLATGILDASYEGLFCVATSNPTRKVFLTFIGGGVFQNSMSWICDAIYKAADKYSMYGLEIVLVCFGSIPPVVQNTVDRFNKKQDKKTCASS